jgi:hypothetical protein
MPLGDERLTLDQIVVVLFVAAADDLEGMVEE